MPGFKGIEKNEIRPGEARAEETKEIDRQVDPFVHPTLIETPGNRSSYEGAKSDGLKDFLAIGEKGTFPGPKTVSLEKAPVSAKQAREEKGLFAGLAHFFRKTVPDFFSNLPIAPVGPMMIFSFLLFPSRDYGKTIEKLDKDLAEFDRVSSLRKKGYDLNPQQKKIFENPNLNALNEKRQMLVKDYQERLEASRQTPAAKIRGEVQHILEEEDISSLFDVFKYMARDRGVSTLFYFGRNLKKATPAEVESFLNWTRTAYSVKRLDQFPFHVMEWMETHRVPGGIPLLRKYLEAPDPRVRLMAAQTLLNLGEKELACDQLLKILYSREKESVRLSAAEFLSTVEDKSYALDFLNLLKNPAEPREIRIVAAEVLGRWKAVDGKRDTINLYMDIEASLKKAGEDDYWELNQLLRVAKALHASGFPISVAKVFEHFLSDSPLEWSLYNSKILEEIPVLVGKLEGSRVLKPLLSLLENSEAPPELRSGAATALGNLHRPVVQQALDLTLRNSKNPEAVRLAALKALLDFSDSSELKRYAYELTNAGSLFVRQGALEALVQLGEGGNVIPVIFSLLSMPNDMMMQQGVSYLEDSRPYAHHELIATQYFNDWAIKTLEGIDPHWEDKITSMKWSDLISLVNEELINLELQVDVLNSSVDPSEMHAPLEMIGRALTEGVLSQGPGHPGSGTQEERALRLHSMNQDAIDAIAFTAKTQVRAVLALLALHWSGNSHALKALLTLDIRAYLKNSAPSPDIVQIIRELGQVGHPEAEEIYKRWRN